MPVSLPETLRDLLTAPGPSGRESSAAAVWQAAARGGGWGRRLAERAVSDVCDTGYQRMRLDTLPAMRSAQSLYLALGLVEIAPYRHNPVPGARCLELDLRPNLRSPLHTP